MGFRCSSDCSSYLGFRNVRMREALNRAGMRDLSFFFASFPMSSSFRGVARILLSRCRDFGESGAFLSQVVSFPGGRKNSSLPFPRFRGLAKNPFSRREDSVESQTIFSPVSTIPERRENSFLPSPQSWGVAKNLVSRGDDSGESEKIHSRLVTFPGWGRKTEGVSLGAPRPAAPVREPQGNHRIGAAGRRARAHTSAWCPPGAAR